MEMEGTAILKNVVGDMGSFPARVIRLPQGEHYTAKDGESTWSWPGAIPDRFGIKAVEGKRTVLIVTGWNRVGLPYLHGFTTDPNAERIAFLAKQWANYCEIRTRLNACQ